MQSFYKIRMHAFLLCKYARVDPFMPYTWEDLFFMKKYMVWLVSIMMAVSMTACSNTAKKEETKQEQSVSKEQAASEKTTENKTTKKTETKKTETKKKDKKKKNEKKDKKTKSTEKTKKNKTTQTTKSIKTTKKSTKTTSKKSKTTKATTQSQKVTTQHHKTMQEVKKEQYCEYSISCKTVLSHKDNLQSNYQVPAGGKIYEKKMKFEEGETVLEVLKRTGIEIDVTKGYVAGIDGLYEFDCGKDSGWMYRVNGKFPNYGAGKCVLKDGDKVEWLYTCVRGDL